MRENNYENFNLSNLHIEIINRKEYLKNKKTIKFNIFEYFIPLWLMRRNNKYSLFLQYKNFIYKDMSLEILIPLIKKLLKLKFVKDSNKRNEYFIKLSYSELNMKINAYN